jgi:hypothetical protein
MLEVTKRFMEERIIGFLREADRGVAVKELCCKHGFAEARRYLWRSQFGGGLDSKPLMLAEAAKASDRYGAADAAAPGLSRTKCDRWNSCSIGSSI